MPAWLPIAASALGGLAGGLFAGRRQPSTAGYTPPPVATDPRYTNLANIYQQYMTEGLPANYRQQLIGQAGRALQSQADVSKQQFGASLAQRNLGGGLGLAHAQQIDVARMNAMENFMQRLSGMDLETKLSALQGLSGLFAGERGREIQERLGLGELALRGSQLQFQKPGGLDYLLALIGGLGPSAIQAFGPRLFPTSQQKLADFQAQQQLDALKTAQRTGFGG